MTAYMILLVLHDPLMLDDILHAWEDAGVPGITVIPSIGLGRLREAAGLRDDAPLIFSISSLLEREETLSRTVLSIVEGEELVDRVIAATESITGNLDNPQSGIITVLPVVKVKGLRRKAMKDEDSLQ